jgi:hypothetical protein
MMSQRPEQADHDRHGERRDSDEQRRPPAPEYGCDQAWKDESGQGSSRGIGDERVHEGDRRQHQCADDGRPTVVPVEPGEHSPSILRSRRTDRSRLLLNVRPCSTPVRGVDRVSIGMPVRYSHRAMNDDIIRLSTAVADTVAGRRLACAAWLGR